MTYHLVVSPEAYEALDSFVEYIAVQKQSPLVATRWLEKAIAALQTLKNFPNQCPPAPENDQHPLTIRMLMVDRCLFLYRVDEKEKVVRVLDFRHASQQPKDLD